MFTNHQFLPFQHHFLSETQDTKPTTPGPAWFPECTEWRVAKMKKRSEAQRVHYSHENLFQTWSRLEKMEGLLFSGALQLQRPVGKKMIRAQFKICKLQSSEVDSPLAPMGLEQLNNTILKCQIRDWLICSESTINLYFDWGARIFFPLKISSLFWDGGG